MGLIGFEFSGVDTFINASVTTKITSASFVLADSNAGDYFDVQVTRDLRFGTFAFNTTGGASKCPVEEHMVGRENPKIDFRPGDSSAALTHPDLPAYFHLKIENLAEDAVATYELVADLKYLMIRLEFSLTVCPWTIRLFSKISLLYILSCAS